MSQSTRPVDLQYVATQERAEIEVRRREAGLPKVGDSRTDLVGVTFSGGGLRSASFCLGIVQALYKSGLWRFVDYLSTVSGGGYIGAYLSSLVVKNHQKLTRDNCPIVHRDHQPQPPEVQRFISGGYFLLRPWELVNKYLIGLFFLNLAIFSCVIMLCTLTAMLWRCLDYPAVRDRLALLELRTDFVVPFIPFSVFSVAWLTAWVISYWRQGAEAPGKIARRLLFLTLASLLIALTMLLGNGDITFGVVGPQASNDGRTAPSSLIASLIGLVFGGLLPFLNPKRLIESGLKADKKPWEKVVFNIASIALLVGMPLVLVGFLGRENISGYNNHPYRAVIKEDIENWRAFVALLGGQDHETLTRKQEPDVELLRDASRPGADAPWLEVQNHLFTPPDTNLSDADSADELFKVIYQQAEEYFQDPRAAFESATTAAAGPESQERFVHNSALAVALDCALVMHDHYDFRLRRQDQWRATHLSKSFQRAFWIAGWLMFPQDEEHWKRFSPMARLTGTPQTASPPDTENVVAEYWNAKVRAEQLEDAVCSIVNEQWLNNSALLMKQIGRFEKPASKEEADTELRGAVSDDTTRRLLGLAQMTDVTRWEPHQRAELNRLLLENAFPEIFRNRGEVRRRVSIGHDQQVRLLYFGVALAVFLGAGMWVDLNATSMHRYYRNRLQSLFLVPQGGKSPTCTLSSLRTTAFGAPYHLMSASIGQLSYLRARTRTESFDPQVSQRENLEKRIIPFLFSQRYCGSERTGYVPTSDYEGTVRGHMNQIDLAEAVALSGSAVCPEHVHNWLAAFLMISFNLRLGQWLPNPNAPPPTMRPTVLYLFAAVAKSLFWQDDPARRQYCFVTDGGFSDNLGLLQLLDRRCRLIIVIDGSCDEKNRFDDLAKALRLARVDRGIRFLELESNEDWAAREFPGASDGQVPTVRNESSEETRREHFSFARILYNAAPDGPAAPAEGLLIYVKPSITGDENLDLLQYRQLNPSFPHESTSDQVFDEAQVESYRQLGCHIGERLARLLPPVRQGLDLWCNEAAAQVDADQLCGWWRNSKLVTQQFAGVNTSVDISGAMAVSPVSDSPGAELPETASATEATEPDPAEDAAERQDNEENGDSEKPESGNGSTIPDFEFTPEPLLVVDAFLHPACNCVEQSTIMAPDSMGSVAAQTEIDDVALHELLANESLLEEALREDSNARSLLLTALESHPSAAVRLMTLVRLEGVPGLSKEVRQIIRQVANEDAHWLVRDRASRLAKRRPRPR